MATNIFQTGALNSGSATKGALNSFGGAAPATQPPQYTPNLSFDQYKSMMGYDPTGKMGKSTKKSLMQGYQGWVSDDYQNAQNRITQQGPSGTIEYVTDPVTGKQIQKTTLNPEQQAALDAQNRVTTGRSNLAADMLGGVRGTLGTPMDWGQFPSLPGGAPGSPTFGTVGAGPSLKTDFGSYDPAALAGMGNVGAGQAGVERAKEYDLQKDLDYSGLGAMPEVNDAVRQRVEQAMYDRAKSRLDPQWAERERSALDRSYAMGQREGDPAMASVMEPLGRERNDAYNQALWDSIIGGGAEQSRLFEMELAKRQQGKSEIDTQGNFRNNALMNQFEQGARNAGFQNAANIANAGFTTQANVASGNNRMQGALAGMDYNLRAGQAGNQALQQQFQNEVTSTGFNNQAGQQGFQNQMQQQDQQMKLREQAIQDALRQRYTGLNEVNALLSGQQVNPNPSFQNYNTASGYEGPNTYDAWLAQRQMDAQNKQAIIGAVGSIGGGIGSAIPFSDRRLKSNIVRVGTTPAGYGWYEYDIFGRREQGVMAQEVPAEWTVRDPSGYLRVDYSKVQ
jgi:hypothetical protein